MQPSNDILTLDDIKFIASSSKNLFDHCINAILKSKIKMNDKTTKFVNDLLSDRYNKLFSKNIKIEIKSFMTDYKNIYYCIYKFTNHFSIILDHESDELIVLNKNSISYHFTALERKYYYDALSIQNDYRMEKVKSIANVSTSFYEKEWMDNISPIKYYRHDDVRIVQPERKLFKGQV